ncbi:unnamed protein product, partial [Iphiclides podalirius]
MSVAPTGRPHSYEVHCSKYPDGGGNSAVRDSEGSSVKELCGFSKMPRVFQIASVLCACLWLASGDVIHLKSAKARLVGSLVHKAKHHKRGILSAVPPFKLGHDIPLVTHSVVKPLVVTYPPTAAVATVKVPLTNPLVPRYPVPVGHRVPVPHPHYGLKFPHSTKSVVLSQPDHHFHHHHHHVSPRPVAPIVPVAPAPAPVPAPAPLPVPAPAPVPTAPLVPVAQPTAPAPLQPVLFHSAPALPAPPVPVAPPPLQILQPHHLHFKPLLPAAVPVQPASVLPAPLFQYAQQFPYVLRHGGAVQTSVFATYPRYPLLNYQSPLLPIAPLAPGVQGAGQVLLKRPQVLLQRPQVLLERPQVPQFHLVPQAGVQSGVVEHGHTNVAVEPTPALLHPQAALPTPTLHLQPAAIPQPTVHLQPTQPSATLDHDGWSPVTAQPHDLTPAHNPEAHYPQPQPHHHFTQEQGTQVFEHHTGEGNYNDLHHQLQHHIQQQIEQAQYEQHLNNQHHQYVTPQQPGQEYGIPNRDFSQQNHDFAYHGQEYAPHDQQYIPNDQQYVNTQDFGQHDQQYVPQDQQFPQQDQQFAQHDQQFAQHDQQFGQHDQQFAQHDQQFAQHDQQFAQHDQQFPQQEQQFAQHDQQFGQHGQGYDLSHQPGQEYGLPQQGPEGRNDDGQESDQQYHNHIPLGLQPPINEPLEHFR